MIVKHYKSLLQLTALIICTLFTAACSDNDDPKNNDFVQLSTSLKEFEENDGLSPMAFKENDEIGVYITKSKEDYTPLDKYTNLKYTLNNGIWTNQYGENGFPQMEHEYNVIAYYPYSAKATASNLIFTIPSNQTSLEKMRGADLRIGGITMSGKHESAGISMKHAFGIITINIKYGMGIEDIVTSAQITAQPTATVNINNGETQILDHEQQIGMAKLLSSPQGYTRSYSCIIPPQNIKGNCLTLHFNDGTSKSYLCNNTIETNRHLSINLSVIGNKDVKFEGISVADWDQKVTITGGTVARVENYKTGDVITYMKNRDEKPVTIVVLPEGFTKEQLTYGGLFEQKARAALDFFFNAEPYKTYKNMFNVYLIAAESNQTGADSLASKKDPTMVAHMRDTYFDAGWEYDGEYNMTINDEKVYNFVKKYCPDIKNGKTDINHVPVFVLINDKRYGGLTRARKDGKAIGMTPMSEGILEWPGVDQKITGISIGDWRNTFLHENGGHAFGRLEDEYVIAGEYTGKDIESHNFEVPFGLNVTADISSGSNTIFWKDLIDDPQFPKVGLYEGGKTYVKGIWRSERISCMIDNRRYFNAWSRYLIAKRIHDIAGLKFTFKDFLKKDVNFDEIVDGARTRAAGISSQHPLHTVKCKPLPHPIVE